MELSAILFDFDYTLGDSTDAIVAGFQSALREMGWPIPDRDTVRGTVGYVLEDAYTMVTGDADPEHRRAFRPKFQKVANPLQRTQCRLFPGARELLEGLKAKGLRLGVVSTKSSATLEGILADRGLLELLDVVIGGDQVTRVKPDPEGLLLAREALGLPVEQILFCGDTVMDAGAAKNAGAHFAAVLNGTTKAQAFESWPCEHIAADLWDLKSWLGA